MQTTAAPGAADLCSLPSLTMATLHAHLHPATAPWPLAQARATAGPARAMRAGSAAQTGRRHGPRMLSAFLRNRETSTRAHGPCLIPALAHASAPPQQGARIPMRRTMRLPAPAPSPNCGNLTPGKAAFGYTTCQHKLNSSKRRKRGARLEWVVSGQLRQGQKRPGMQRSDGEGRQASSSIEQPHIACR